MRKLLLLTILLFPFSIHAMTSPIPNVMGATAVTSASRFIGFSRGGAPSLNGTESIVFDIMGDAGTVGNLAASVTVAPGAGKSWTYTLYLNSSPSALTCTISDAATTCTDTTHSVSVSPFDTVSWQQTPSGTPAATKFALASTFTGTADGETNISSGSSGAPSATVTNYTPISSDRFTTSESFGRQVMPTSGAFDGFYLEGTGAPGAGTSYTITLFKNGSASALTCDIADANTTCSDTAHSVSFSRGDTISIGIVPNSSPGSLTNFRWALRFKPTTNGETPIMYRPDSLTNSADRYAGLSGTLAAGATETDIQVPAPVAYTISDLYTTVSAAPGAGKSWAITLRNGAASQALSATIADLNTTAEDTSDDVSVNAGDLLNWLVSPSGTPAGGGSPARVSAVAFIAPAGGGATPPPFDDTTFELSDE